jgi:hypothetical protein
VPPGYRPGSVAFPTDGPAPARRRPRLPRSRVFDAVLGAAALGLLVVVGFVLSGAFRVTPLYDDEPVPRSSTARNECQALVIDRIGDLDTVTFDDGNSSEVLRSDRSWVVRGSLEVREIGGDERSGEYVCDGLRELPPGSDRWRSDRVTVLGV